MLIGDLETDNLFPAVTKIHCATFYDTSNDETFIFTPDNVNMIPELLRAYKHICFHNYYGFDGLVLKKIFNYVHPHLVYDTLLVSRALWPDKEGKNPHSVEAYGEEFGVSKPEHEDWTVFSKDMLHRNREDVRIQTLIYEKQQKYITQMIINDSRLTQKDFSEVFLLEFKVAEIITQQAINGFAFDLRLAYELMERLSTTIKQVEEQLLPQMPIKIVRVTDKETKAFNLDGSLSANATKWLSANGDDLSLVGGNFSKIRIEYFNLASSAQVKQYLLDNGWKPTAYNVKKDKFGKPERDKFGKHIKASPKSPSTAEEWEQLSTQLNSPKIKLLAEYNKANHKLHQIEGFIRNLRPEDHRIEARANTVGTNTCRMRHSVVVNVGKANDKVYYGKEIRSLFKAGDRKVLVGVDACALEARVEAHYLFSFDKAGAIEILEGDIHTKNALAFGSTRDEAKSGKYALTYGCSESKLAATLNKPAKDAKRLYEAFWEANPGLKQLKDSVEESYNKYGYLRSIDNRPLTIRYKHALINTLFQSAGSIIMKRALILLQQELESMKMRYWFVGNFHDEFQIECFPEDAETIGTLACECIHQAGLYHKLNVEMAGEYKVGLNWSETH